MLRKLFYLFSLIMLASIVFSACGGGGTANNSSTATPAPEVSESTEPVVSEEAKAYCDDTASVQYYRDCMEVAKDQAGRQQVSDNVSECVSQMNPLEYVIHQLWPWSTDCN